MIGFVVPRCPLCGHAEGSHRITRGHILTPPRLGVCLHPGCDCRGHHDDRTPSEFPESFQDRQERSTP